MTHKFGRACNFLYVALVHEESFNCHVELQTPDLSSTGPVRGGTRGTSYPGR